MIHDIDFVNYILGAPTSIKCNYIPGFLSNHDYINAEWYYHDKNIKVKIEGGNIFHSKFPFQAGYIAKFEKASMVYNTLNGQMVQIAKNNQLEEIFTGDDGEGYYNEIEYFAKCIKDNSMPFKCMPESSLKAIQLCYNHL